MAALVLPSLLLAYTIGGKLRDYGRRSQERLATVAALVNEALVDLRWLKTTAVSGVHASAERVLDEQLAIKRRGAHLGAATDALVPGLVIAAAALAILGGRRQLE